MRQSTSVIDVGVTYMRVVHISKCLKVQLAWVTDKQLWLINNV